MKGNIVWWNQKQTKGVAVVTENGTTQHYFLLASRILSSPEVIETGDVVEFSGVLPALRPDLLPLATGVCITKKSNIAGVTALSKVGA